MLPVSAFCVDLAKFLAERQKLQAFDCSSCRLPVYTDLSQVPN